MKLFATIVSLMMLGILHAHPDHDHSTLPEEPSHLYAPSDITDIFAIQLDNDALEDEEELETLEKIQKEEQAQKSQPKK